MNRHRGMRFRDGGRQMRIGVRRWIAVLCAGMAAQAVSAAPGPERMRQELLALQPAITLAAWLERHPQDEVRLFSHLDGDKIRGWCARATLSGASAPALLRHAYFFGPETPSDLLLPAMADSSSLAGSGCVLGAIWVEWQTSHADSAMAETGRWIDALRMDHGDEKRVPRIRERTGALRQLGFYTGPRDSEVYWQTDAVTVLMARVPAKEVQVERVFALAATPTAAAAHYSGRDAWDRQQGNERRYELAERAATSSGTSTELARPLLKLMRAADVHENLDRKPAMREEAAELLGTWFEAASKRPASERAAALLVADCVLASRWLVFLNRDTSISAMRRFQRLGAKFAHLPLGGGYIYKRNWSREARTLDRGAIGHLAHLDQLERGHDYACNDGSDAYQRVIEEGEQLLPHLEEPQERAWLHFLVARAHADIVGLADGAAKDFVDHELVGRIEQAEGARARAIEHLRQGLALDGEMELASESWVLGWRLLAGLPPRTLRYHCFYD